MVKKSFKNTVADNNIAFAPTGEDYVISYYEREYGKDEWVHKYTGPITKEGVYVALAYETQYRSFLRIDNIKHW